MMDSDDSFSALGGVLIFSGAVELPQRLCHPDQLHANLER
jgi:hypothetical protein